MNTGTVVIEEDSEEDEKEPAENEEEVVVRPKRKLTSPVWKEFKKVKVINRMKAKCNWCSKKLGGEPTNGTKHLHDHLKICPYRKRPADSKKQTSLRYSSNVQGGKVVVENYTFDEDVARKALGSMILLHDYPLSIVDHIGFRKFVSALQPLFKMVTRNTIRKDGLDVLEESIEKIRDSVAFWTSTPKRIENFQEVAKMLKIDRSKKLSLDVKTRWNSTVRSCKIYVV